MDTNVSFIYGLFDPRDGSLRYIGQTTQLVKRKSYHINGHGSMKLPKTRWVHDLLRIGLRPKFEVLAKTSIECISGLETAMIRVARSQGFDLLNVSDGGERPPVLTEAGRAKLKTLWVGRKHTQEARMKMSRAKSGVPLTHGPAWHAGRKEALAKSWAVRRAKYGASGHG